MKPFAACRIVLVASLPFSTALAQPVAAKPEFDVASVKPSTRGSGNLLNINLGGARNGVVTLTNTTLSECILYAYGLVSEDQISGPDWIRDRELRVDIVAKASRDTPVDQLLRMTQTLLADRFRLALHREPKQISHLELGLAKSGAKLPASKSDAPSFAPTYGRGRLSYSRITTHTLAVLLARQLRELVIDTTEINGFFDVNLEWAPDDAQAATLADDRPDIFSAVQEQLGLRLERKRTPVEILVVDSAEKAPIGN